MRSASPNFGGTGSMVGFGIGGNMARPPYATGPAMGSMSTRNALNSGVCALASRHRRRQRVDRRRLLGQADEAEVQRHADRCTVLPSICSGVSRLVTIALPLTSPRFDQTRTICPGWMPFSAASSSRHLDEELGLQHRVDAARSSSSSGSARSAGRWWRRSGTPRRRRRSRSRRRTPATPGCPGPSGTSGWSPAPRTARSAPGTARPPSCPATQRRETPSGFMMNGPDAVARRVRRRRSPARPARSSFSPSQ